MVVARFKFRSIERWKWPNKCKPKALGGDTLATLAHKCRTCDIKLKELNMDEIGGQEQLSAAAPNPTVETLGNANDDEPPPSFFLRDRNWVRQMHLSCAGGLFVEPGRCDDSNG